MDVYNSVLLIVDSPKINKAISESCEKFKRVYFANNIIEAKTLLSSNKIDVVIIDFKNINDEITITKELNLLFFGPIIVVIENLAEFTVHQLIDLGIDDFVPENFCPKELLRIITNAIKKKKIDASLISIGKKLELCRQNY